MISATCENVDGIRYELTMPDGSVESGTAAVNGVIKLTGLTQRGDCKLRFPSIDEREGQS